MLGFESLLDGVDELVVLEEPESVETLSLLQAVRPTSIDNMITVDISFRFIENLTKQIIDVRLECVHINRNVWIIKRILRIIARRCVDVPYKI